MRLILVIALVAALGYDATALSAAETSIARFREREYAHSRVGTFGGAPEVWRVKIYLRNVQQVIGTGYFGCQKNAPGSPELLCVGVYVLPRGSIYLQGLVRRRSNYNLVVVAGSGVYSGMGGEGHFVGIATSPRQALVTFFLK